MSDSSSDYGLDDVRPPEASQRGKAPVAPKFTPQAPPKKAPATKPQVADMISDSESGDSYSSLGEISKDGEGSAVGDWLEELEEENVRLLLMTTP